MFKRFVSVFAALSFIIVSFYAYASAEVTAALKQDFGRSQIKLEGSANGAVVITVAPADLSLEAMSAQNLPTIVKQIKATGTYSCTLYMPVYAEGGKYTVYVSSNDGEASPLYFMHINEAEVDNILVDGEPLMDHLHKSDGAVFADLIQTYAAKIGIDRTDELYLNNESKLLPMLDKMKFTDVFDFADKYNIYYAVNALSGANSEKVSQMLQQYQAQLGIDYAADFEDETRLTANAKNKMLEHLSALDYNSYIEDDGTIPFKEVFENAKPLAAIQSVHSWIALKRIIVGDFASVFAQMLADNAKYGTLRDKDRVFELMMSKKYSEFADIEKNFNSAVNTVYSESSVGSSSRPAGGANTSASGGEAITVPPASEEADEVMFYDLDTSHWSFMAVSALYKAGIVSGYQDGSFHPSNHITRAEFAKLISEFVENFDIDNAIAFQDVQASDWYSAAIAAVSAGGLIEGDGVNFYPNRYITREDAAVILFRLLKSKGRELRGNKYFADRNEISDYAKNAVVALGEAQIVKGIGNNMFMPKNNITRAESAQLIYNAMSSLE